MLSVAFSFIRSLNVFSNFCTVNMPRLFCSICSSPARAHSNTVNLWGGSLTFPALCGDRFAAAHPAGPYPAPTLDIAFAQTVCANQVRGVCAARISQQKKHCPLCSNRLLQIIHFRLEKTGSIGDLLSFLNLEPKCRSHRRPIMYT